MQIIKIDNGQPSGGPVPIPNTYENISHPKFAQMKERGWAEYVAPEFDRFRQRLGEYTRAGEVWTQSLVDLSPEEVAEMVDSMRRDLIALVKTEAEAKILSIIPEWQQRNATARAVEIVNAKLMSVATAADLAELAKIQAAFDMVKAVRLASNLIEAEIAAGIITNDDQVQTSSHWPLVR